MLSLRQPSHNAFVRLIARALIAALVFALLPPQTRASYSHAPAIDRFADRFVPTLAPESPLVVIIALTEHAAYVAAIPTGVFFDVGCVLSDPAFANKYHRARWMDPRVGRFASMDIWRGSVSNPIELHRYAYASLDPGNRIDPTGQFTGVEVIAVAAFLSALAGGLAILKWNVWGRPRFQRVENRIVAGTNGCYKKFQLQISGPDAGAQFLVVQWVRGRYLENGRSPVPTNPHGGYDRTFDFPDYQIDSMWRTDAEYPGLTKHKDNIVLKDEPGRHGSIPSSTKVEADLDFIVAVHSKSRFSTPRAHYTEFIDPWTPTPLAFHRWTFYYPPKPGDPQ